MPARQRRVTGSNHRSEYLIARGARPVYFAIYRIDQSRLREDLLREAPQDRGLARVQETRGKERAVMDEGDPADKRDDISERSRLAGRPRRGGIIYGGTR